MSPVPTTEGAVASRPAVEVSGAPLDPAVAGALRSTVVDTDASGPDACRLTFDDPARKVLAASRVALGGPLTVAAGRVGDDAGDVLFDGIVYALGFEHDDRGAFTVVTAYDRSYSLYSGVHTATYLNVTDADLVGLVAQAVGLQTGPVEPTPVLHEHVAQVNETYHEFLSRRAAEVGCHVRVVGRELQLLRATSSDDAPAPGDLGAQDRLQLVPGDNVRRLDVRVSGAQQVATVEVRGWDHSNQRALVSTAGASTRTATLTDTPATVAEAFGGPTLVRSDLPLTTAAECEAVATATAERIGGTSVHAEGVAYGDPRIRAGAAVSLGGTGGRFDGKVTVTRARHTWDGSGYRTSFVASGANDRSVLGLVGGRRQVTAPSLGGVVVGVVTNLDDPDSIGRVKVRLPWLHDDFETDWARVVHLGAGKERGLLLTPEVDDEVLVAFERGDARRPYVIGGLYNGRDAPPQDVVDSSGAVRKRLWRSRTGHEIVLDDTGGAEQVTIGTGNGEVTVVLDGANRSVTVSSSGDVSVSAGGNLTLEASGDASVRAGGSLTLEASSDVTVKGSVIKLN